MIAFYQPTTSSSMGTYGADGGTADTYDTGTNNLPAVIYIITYRTDGSVPDVEPQHEEPESDLPPEPPSFPEPVATPSAPKPIQFLNSWQLARPPPPVFHYGTLA